MASAETIDIEQLCAPVSAELPVGPYWRDDDHCANILYPRLDTAVQTAKENEKKKAKFALFAADAVEGRDDRERRNFDEPNWREVIVAGEKVLEQTKDLWVAAWMIESLSREHGFAGMRDGFALTLKLCTTYWDSIHPRPDEYDGEARTTMKLSGDLFAKLVTLMPITRSGLTTEDYEKSAAMEGLTSDSERQEYRALGVVSTAEFESAVRDSGPEFLQDLYDDAQAASENYDALTEFLDERCGLNAPASSQAQQAMRDTIELIRELVGPYLPLPEEAVASEEGEPETNSEAVAGPQATLQPNGWDRDLAFKDISRIAELFAKHEPNSPVASILRQAVHVGRLSWADMIKGFLQSQDSEALTEILKQTGGAALMTSESDD